MKKSIAMLFGVLSIATAANAQFSSEKIKGNGNVIKKNVTTPDYEKVVVSGFFDVDLVAGKEGKIAVEGEENLLQHLKIEVADNGIGLPENFSFDTTDTLGIQLIKTLVSQINGSIEVSKSPGARFTIIFTEQRSPL